MPQGALIRKSGVERHLLQAAQDCLRWSYAEYDRPARCQLEFWAWAMPLDTSDLLSPKTPHARSVLEQSAGWPWLRLQRRARRFLERLFGGMRGERPPTVAVAQRALLPVRTKSGQMVVRWRPLFRPPKKPWDLVLFFLDELLADLDGVSEDVVARCALCGHYFIRVAARRRNYCSDTCRNRALYRRRKSRRTVPHAGKRRRATA
jgi:hypothetical protein